MEEKIIKARPEPEAAGMSGARYLKRDIYDAGVDAGRILEAAHEEARAVLDDVQRRRDAIVQAAREEGFRHGLAEWDLALQSAREAQESLDAQYESEIVRMAVKIAEKIVGEELRTRPETIVSIARECLRGVRHEHSLTVRVNPDEVDEVQRNLSSLAEVAGAGRRIQILPDGGVAPGGCIVESAVGVIDARLETQLRCLEEILLRVAVRR
jgi:type III secretion protein L